MSALVAREVAVAFATERLNREADVLPLLDTKRRELFVLMMAECYLEGAGRAFDLSGALVNKAFGG